MIKLKAESNLRSLPPSPSENIVLWRKEMLELAKEKAPVPVTVELPPQESEPATPSALTFKQQLLLAAVQALCANPAHATSFEEIPHMASVIADCLSPEYDACTE